VSQYVDVGRRGTAWNWGPPDGALARLRTCAIAVAVGTMALAVVLAVPWIAMNAAIAARPALASLDPDDTFGYITVHHAVMALLAIGLMLLAGQPIRDRRMAPGSRRVAARALAVFVPVVAVLAFAFDALPFIASGTAPALPYAFTPANVIGTLAFQWLFVGVGEELLFRGLLLGMLARTVEAQIRVGRFRVSAAVVVSAVVFALAHGVIYQGAFMLPFRFDPNWSQVAWAFVLGIFCGSLRQRTGSLLGPIVGHNVANGLVLSMTYLAVVVAR
jgi:membrane protease YdiL (CAAX protease family)